MNYEWLSLTLAVVAFAHASYKTTYQARQRRRLTEREFRWKQTEQARSILDDMEDDEFAAAAMLMLDYQDNRPFEIKRKTYAFGEATIEHALRTTETNFNNDEVLIRDCFELLLLS